MKGLAPFFVHHERELNRFLTFDEQHKPSLRCGTAGLFSKNEKKVRSDSACKKNKAWLDGLRINYHYSFFSVLLSCEGSELDVCTSTIKHKDVWTSIWLFHHWRILNPWTQVYP